MRWLIYYLPNPNTDTLLLLLISLWVEGRRSVTALLHPRQSFIGLLFIVAINVRFRFEDSLLENLMIEALAVILTRGEDNSTGMGVHRRI
jgi:hypothetical protein